MSSLALDGTVTGSFTSDGTAIKIDLPCGYDSFEMVNITDCGSAAAATPVMRAKGYSSLPAGYAYYNTKTNGAATLDIETTTTTNGFTWINDSTAESIGGAVAVTGITAADPAVVTSASAAVVGDIVRIYNTTAMLQVAGWDFSVTAVNPGVTQTLGYLDASGFAAAATGGSIRIVPFDSVMYPRYRLITGITAADPAVITMSVTHGFTVGQKVRVIVPESFGMTEINDTVATITAISTANNTITLGSVDSSGYTAFAFPTSAQAAAGVDYPMVVPVGEDASYPGSTDDASYNTAFRGIIVGTSVQTTGKLYQWIARKATAI